MAYQEDLKEKAGARLAEEIESSDPLCGTALDFARRTGEADTLGAIVELQRVELTRLLQENKQLSNRVDNLIKLHEREQVLRQQTLLALHRLSEEMSRLSSGADETRAAPRHPRSGMREASPPATNLKAALLQLVNLLEQKRA
ncbi:MAG TPA: hypothetical protein VKY65_10080 [Alphaproteobacteria bacterium]|nr:hypothetical protein [Alphaproteobacteria bacterium]